MTAIFITLLGFFLFICLVLTLLVLIQKGRGGGLASAFGGGGGNTAFGSKTGDVLTWATSIVFGLFLLLAIFLNLVANKIHAKETSVATVVAAPSALPTPGSENPASATATIPLERTTGVPVPVTAPTTAPSTQPGN